MLQASPPLAMASNSTFHLLLVAIILLLRRSLAGHDRNSFVSREAFALDGDVAWVVQISDLHLSSFDPDRGRDLKRLLPTALRVIRPVLILITGDLTDANNRKRASTRQDEMEWVQYKEVMDAVVSESGLERRRFFDVRGNHDVYGVPYVGSELDFFSNYSISAQLNRLSTIQSVSLLGNKYNYIFLGIDDSLSPGLRGPSNIFGHPTDKQMETVELELDYWDDNMEEFIVKIVFGHFPISFTASSEKGKRYEDLFARKSVNAYLCGHLHAKFSDQLWKLHSVPLASQHQQAEMIGQFWEWEVGDWKESRLMRILSLDNGEVSFVDIKLESNLKEFHSTVLVTHPLDARNMIKNSVRNKVPRNDINALVFSSEPILNVTAKIYDGVNGLILMEELPMLATSGKDGPLFRAYMEPGKYRSTSGIRFWLEVVVIDVRGLETSTKLRPFSMEGERADLAKSWIIYLTFHTRWETLYFVLLRSNITFLTFFLVLPKVLKYFLRLNPHRNREMSLLMSMQTGQRQITLWPIWFLLQGSSDGRLWWAMLFYLLYLLMFPWFWGHATSEHDSVSYMSMLGWTVTLTDNKTLNGIGVPDVMTIVLPFMYFVVTPMFVLIYSLLVEKAAADVHSGKENGKSQESKHLKMEANTMQPFSVSASSKRPRRCGWTRIPLLRGGWTRIPLLFACFVIFYFHFKICTNIIASFGTGVVMFSPAFIWVPPILMALAVYLTQPRVTKCHAKI